MQKILRVKDLQQIFGCSKERAYKLANSKGFPSIKIGKQIYIPEEELAKWIEMYTYKEFKI